MDVIAHVFLLNVSLLSAFQADPEALLISGSFSVLFFAGIIGVFLIWLLLRYYGNIQFSKCAQFLPGVVVRFEKSGNDWLVAVLSGGSTDAAYRLEVFLPEGKRFRLNQVFQDSEARVIADVLENAYKLKISVNHECRLRKDSAEGEWVSILASPSGSGKRPVLNGVVFSIMDRRILERELFEEKQFAEQMLESSGVVISVCDRNGKLFRANRAFFDIGGYTPDEIYFSEADRSLLGESYEPVMRLFKDVLDGNAPIVAENPWYCKDGSSRIMRWTNTALRNSEGELAYVMSVGTDITDLRALEEQLKNKVDEFSTLFENSLVGMALIVNGRIAKANQVCAEMLGYTSEEISNLSVDGLFSDKNAFNGFMTEVFPRIYRGLRHFDYSFRKKDGKYGEFRISASPLVGDAETNQIIIVLDEVSEIKMVERALLRSETRFRTIVDKMASGLALINEAGFFEEVNDSWCRITGYSREEALSLSVLDITQNEDVFVSRNIMRSLLADTEEMKRMEKRYIRKDGTTIWVDLTASKIDERASYGKTTLLSIINDISERKAIEEELKSMNSRLEAESVNVQIMADQRMAVFKLFDTFRESKSIEDLIDILKHNLPKLVEYHDLVIALRVSRTDPDYVIRDIYNETPEEEIRRLLKDGGGIIGSVLRSRTLYLSKDVSQDPYFVNHNSSVRSYLALPILYKDFLWGVIGLDNFSENYFTDQDVEILTMVGTMIAMQMEEMTTKLALYQESHRLKILHEMVQEMAKARDNEDIIRQICSGRLFNEVHVHRVSTEGIIQPCVCWECVKNGATVPEPLESAEDGKPVFWENSDSPGRNNMGIAIRYNETCLGMLRLTSELDFSDSDIELGSILAEQAGVFLELNNLIVQREREAMIDPLTGVWNRRYMFERLEQEDERLTRYGGVACVAILDMGDFKLINDTYGHVKGDEILIASARVIENSIRRTDFVGRYGGDEFILFLPNTDLNEADKIYEKIRKNIAGVTIEGIRHTIDVDGGVAVVPGDDVTLLGAIRAADEKMYFNKRERKRQSLLRN